MIYDDENRGRVWEPDPQMQAPQMQAPQMQAPQYSPQPDPQQAIETIESKCHPGAIYLLHAVSQTNAQVLGQVIDELRAQGYTFCAYGE